MPTETKTIIESKNIIIFLLSCRDQWIQKKVIRKIYMFCKMELFNFDIGYQIQFTYSA